MDVARAAGEAAQQHASAASNKKLAAVGSAAEELEQAGYELLHPPRTEPWGQTVAWLQLPEGAIVGISYTPRSTTKTEGLPQPTAPSGNLDPPPKGRRRAALRLVSLP